MSESHQLFLDQYQKELRYLRESGAEFAKEYPKIAKRLEWDAEESKDPHVERLIESFAFLTSKLQRNIDDRFPVVASALLSTIYPQFITPIPSMSIANFTLEKSKIPPGYIIPKGTLLNIQSNENVVCKFQTGYDLKIFPIVVEDAKIFVRDGLKLPDELTSSSHILKLHLKSKGVTFEEMQGVLNELPVYLSGDSVVVSILYDSLFFATGRIIAEDLEGKKTYIFPNDSLKNIGFSKEESIIPGAFNGHAAYRLIQEFFAFPQKFLFFNITNIKLSGIKNDLVLYIPLTHKISQYSKSVSKENFILNCTPIINIFKKTTEPLRIDQKNTEYRLIADNKHDQTTEIHSIEKITAVLGKQQNRTDLPAYFSYDFETLKDPNKIYWFATRKPTKQLGIPGTDLWLNFVDFNFRADIPATDILWGDVWCTNRFAAEQVPAGGKLAPEEPLSCGKIICLHTPTSQFTPAETGEAQWRLISHMNLNYLSLLETDRFKNLLYLYVPSKNSSAFKDIQGIHNISSQPKVRRVTNEAWRGFVQGLGIDITLDEREFVGSSMHLFGEVLYHFLGLYVSFNSFIEVSLKTNKQSDIIKTWKPLCGYQNLL